jgi:hypothetical protein
VSQALHFNPSGGASNLANVQPFSLATPYQKGDVVRFLGSTFVAKNPLAAGASPSPLADSTNWALIAQGSGEIAYAQYSGIWNLTTAGTINTNIDVPGVSIVVPANSGRVKLEAICGAVQISGTASAVAGEAVIFKLQITDPNITAPGTIAQGIWRHVASRASENRFQPVAAHAVVPNSAVDRTFKLQAFQDTTQSGHQTVNLWAGDGGGNNNPGPLYLRAVTT